ncbi:ammonium transporter, Amt family [Modicisalibacter xianhensis]|uniref:Ammonium transporter, Amt family n=1 Tax=Modicisalibacter xianhensis TaxID=442341 RepID=A0A1I3BSF6_9GAMM|nr:ammonium transporter, Amt family [Halomonas xianhensis]
MSAQTVDGISGLVAVNSLMAMLAGAMIYGGLKAVVGIRLDKEQEYEGADLALHKINATPRSES